MSNSNKPDFKQGARAVGGFGFNLSDQSFGISNQGESAIFEDDQGNETPLTTEDLILVLIDKVDTLQNKVDLIFGNSIIVNGSFIDVSKLLGGG